MTESWKCSSTLRASTTRLSRVGSVETRLTDSLIDGEEVETVADVVGCSGSKLAVRILQSRLRDAIVGRFHVVEKMSQLTLGCC